MVGTLGGIVTKTKEATLTERASHRPFRVALIGDFSARSSRGEAPRGGRLAGVTPLLIDSEDFGEVMGRVGIELRLSREGEETLSFRFQALDDFHPDKLCQTEPVESFRKKLEPGGAGQALGDYLRAIVGHPQFQTLESAWRSVGFLLSRLETGSNLRIELIDITREEMVTDMLASDDMSASGLYRMLVEEAVGTPGQAPWSALAPLDLFAPRDHDLLALERLAGIARLAGAPLLAGADPAFAGCHSVTACPDTDKWKQPLENSIRRMWEELRRHSAAAWIGLAMPRFLLRLPYGQETAPVASFGFEEMPEPPRHDGYLWGSAGVACVCLLGYAYNRHGWNFRPGKVSKLEGLPVHTFTREGLSVMMPAAEVSLTDKATEHIMEMGIMPLGAVKNSDAIQLLRFQSIAMPPRPLAGPWD
ncbi:MAG: type VI secretion system contractile sheath large subunit [Acidobacteriia bacterium]|nr:type VI secretion system contractile sheath large subunit [Terriglobia bacterium]